MRWLIVPLLFVATPAAAKDPKGVIEIRQLYKGIKSQQKAGELVEHRIKTNANQLSWPGVGVWEEDIKVFAVVGPGGVTNVALIEYADGLAAFATKIEYVFDDEGRLRFAWVRGLGASGDDGFDELRFYFDKRKKRVRVQADKRVIDKPNKLLRTLQVDVEKHAKELRAFAETLGSNHPGFQYTVEEVLNR